MGMHRGQQAVASSRGRFNYLRPTLAVLLSTFSFVSAAQAVTLGPLNCIGVPPVGLAPTELNGALSCPQFSVAGVLTGMTLTLSGDVAGTISITNQTTQTQDGSSATQVTFNVGPLAGFAISNPFLTVTHSTGPISVAPGVTDIFPVAGTQTESLVNSTTFAPYIGAGSFAVPVDTTTFLLLTFGGGNVTAKQNTTAAARGTVTYEYDLMTNIPEPTTLALLGTGILAGVIRRRRRR